LLIGGKIGIELELALDPEIRKACADNDLGVIYFLPHISKLFHYWEEGATDAARFLKTIDGIADLTGHPEIKRVPWITMGHSTGGMFCRNVAYWQPARVGGIIHVRSGNLFQKVHYPPSGSLAGVPFLAVNGQFETYGPGGGNRPHFGRETLIYFNREDMQKLQQLDPNHLAALLVELGGDHFHDSVETSAYIALFIRKIAHYRLPGTLPPAVGPVKVMPIKREDGWLSDADLYDRKHATAPFANYTGDKSKAWWHFDGEIARAGGRRLAPQCGQLPGPQFPNRHLAR
jgi:pimeloyl-ACP methyl ester carboxylesterase